MGDFRYSYTQFLTSALEGCEWSASRLGRFNRKEVAPRTHWIEAGWASEPFLTRWLREKFPAPAGNRTLNLDRPARSPALYGKIKIRNYFFSVGALRQITVRYFT
jgi:hypothetical protein